MRKVYEIKVQAEGVKPFRTMNEADAMLFYNSMVKTYGKDKVSYREEPEISHKAN